MQGKRGVSAQRDGRQPLRPNVVERIRIEIVSISLLTPPSYYGKSVVFPCVRLRVVALATTRAIRIFTMESL